MINNCLICLKPIPRGGRNTKRSITSVTCNSNCSKVFTRISKYNSSKSYSEIYSRRVMIKKWIDEIEKIVDILQKLMENELRQKTK